jgi:hypothetical protein
MMRTSKKIEMVIKDLKHIKKCIKELEKELKFSLSNHSQQNKVEQTTSSFSGLESGVTVRIGDSGMSGSADSHKGRGEGK